MDHRDTKTLRMRVLEMERGKTVEEIIRELAEQGASEEQIAANLGIGKVALVRWNKLLGRRTRISKSVCFASEEAKEMATAP